MVGAGVGAIAGALIGMGVPEEHAKYYEGEVKSGRTLVTVRAPQRYPEARELLRQYGAYDIESGDPGAAAPLAGALTERGQDRAAQTVELRAEELEARKKSVESGEVRLGKNVVEEQRTLDVPVTHEEVFIERHAVDRPSDRPIEREASRTIEVPLHEERVELQKQAVVYEEVSVGKAQVQETQHVSDTVRHEVARIEREGDVNLTDDAGDTAYVRELRNDPRYQGRAWSEIEGDVERGWTARNPTSPWADARERLRRNWDDAPA